MGLTLLVEHEISMQPRARPIRQQARKMGHEKVVEAQVQELLERNLIEPSNSAWSSLAVLVRKKDEKWRFCVDYRKSTPSHNRMPPPSLELRRASTP